MDICNTVQTYCSLREKWRDEGYQISFVPTMGALHDGHLSLVGLASSSSPQPNRVVVSIFVNPAQFNDPRDLEQYPRNTGDDLKLLDERGVDAVFLPTPEMIYGDGFKSWISVEGLSSSFEGASRPGHFRGVATVVSLLFRIIEPDYAVFGEKDFQQLRVIEQMVKDHKIPVRIVRGPLIREPDGLAMSSRNVRLTEAGRKKAVEISNSLRAALALFQDGERSADALIGVITARLQGLSHVEIDYVSVVVEDKLEALQTVPQEGARILVAVAIDGVRLLDNIALR